MTRVAVVTLAAGRHEHLRGLLWGLDRQARPADLVVVVSMGDPAVAAIAGEYGPAVLAPEVPPTDDGFRLAAARNAGAEAALRAGADVLVFLDVDCIPSASLVGRYTEVVLTRGRVRPVAACGEVAYLPDLGSPLWYRHPEVLSGAEPHPARPRLGPDSVTAGGDVHLFWSLSFAMTAVDWRAVGGFDESYVGYGGEDTDFGQRLRRTGGELLWVGGATAYHQFHDVENPPIRHVDSIVRNANLFHRTWGWYPMTGWLEAFESAGIARRDERTGDWVVSSPTRARS